MRKIIGRRRSVWGWKYTENTATGCISGVFGAATLAVIGGLLCFVPILGWIAAPICWFLAFVALLTAIGAPIVSLFTTNAKTENAAIIQRAENTYADLICPACMKPDPFKGNRLVSWPSSKNNTLLCQYCQKISHRVGDRLLWVPYEQVTLSGSIDEFVQTEQQSVSANLKNPDS
jgi:hypothetical protein